MGCRATTVSRVSAARSGRLRPCLRLLDDSARGRRGARIDGKTLRGLRRAAARPARRTLRQRGAGSDRQRAVAEGENEIWPPGDAGEPGARRHAGTATRSTPGGHRRGDPRAGRRLPLRAQGQPPAMLREVEAFFADPPEVSTPSRPPMPTMAASRPVATGNPRHRLALLRSPLRRRARLPGLATLACVEATHAGRQDHPGDPLLPQFGPPRPESFAARPRPLGDREQPALGLDVTFDEDAPQPRDNGRKPRILAGSKAKRAKMLERRRGSS